MNRIIKVAAMAATIITFASCAPYSQSENFDTNVLASQESGWAVVADKADDAMAVWSENEGVEGSGCIALSAQSRGTLYVARTFEGLNPAKLYRASAWLRTEDVAEGRGAIMRVETAESKQVWNASEFTYGTNDWKEVYIDFVPGADGAAEVRLSLGSFPGTYNGGTALGKAWWDNLTVAEVTAEQLYTRESEHIILSVDKDKMVISDEAVDEWLANLDKMYEAYEELVGAVPFEGKKIRILTTPGIEPGYWALAGNPILWNNHVGIDKLLTRTAEQGDWNFGIMHEIGHVFSSGQIFGRAKWNWNDEIFANFRMSYGLEAVGGTMSQRDVLYTGAEADNYYKIFFDETIGAGVVRDNGDALHYTFLRIKERYGWDVYKKAFRALYAMENENIPNFANKAEAVMFFLSVVSEAAGEDVTTTCYTPEELSIIRKSLGGE